MTKEQKQLLLIDLCARLPYGVKCVFLEKMPEWFVSKYGGDEDIKIGFTLSYENFYSIVKDLSIIKPYLRPMPYLHPTSSMTEEEKSDYDWFCSSHPLEEGLAKDFTDWLNAHHFDYRGLIPLGLALEAPEDMYKTK